MLRSFLVFAAISYFFDSVTSDNLTWHVPSKSLAKVFRSLTDTFHADLLALFHRVITSSKGKHSKSSKPLLLTWSQTSAGTPRGKQIYFSPRWSSHGHWTALNSNQSVVIYKISAKRRLKYMLLKQVQNVIRNPFKVASQFSLIILKTIRNAYFFRIDSYLYSSGATLFALTFTGVNLCTGRWLWLQSYTPLSIDTYLPSYWGLVQSHCNTTRREWPRPDLNRAHLLRLFTLIRRPLTNVLILFVVSVRRFRVCSYRLRIATDGDTEYCKKFVDEKETLPTSVHS